MRLVAFSVALLVLSYKPLRAEDPQPDGWRWGPIEMANQYPLSLLHSGFYPRTPFLLEPEETELRAAFDWSNTSVLHHPYRVDAETRIVDLDLKHAASPGLELGARLPLEWRGGGVLDRFISSWHDFFGLPGGNRGSIADNQFDIAGLNDDSSSFRFDKTGYSLGNLELNAAYSLVKKDAVAAKFVFEAGLPTARDTFGHDGLDLTTGLALGLKSGSFGYYAGAGYLFYTHPEVHNVNFGRNHPEAYAHVEYRAFEAVSFLTGFYAGTNQIIDVVNHPDYFIYLDLGGKVRLSRELNLECLVRENPWAGYSTADVTMELGLDWIFA